MTRVEVWVMDLPPRKRFTKVSGFDQSKPRALFIALLPPGQEMHTAAGVVKLTLPGREDQDVYVAHYVPLGTLARRHGLKVGGTPGPDNKDPETGERLLGKKPGTFQPCKWNRDHWLEMVSDSVYEWLRKLNALIAAITTEHPNSRFFCDIETWQITSTPVTDQLAQPLPESDPKEKAHAAKSEPNQEEHPADSANQEEPNAADSANQEEPNTADSANQEEPHGFDSELSQKEAHTPESGPDFMEIQAQQCRP